MSQQNSAFLQSLDKIVADCQLNLKWVAYSKDRLTKAEGVSGSTFCAVLITRITPGTRIILRSA